MPTSGFGVGYSVMNSDNRQVASLAFLWPALAAETASEFAAANIRLQHVRGPLEAVAAGYTFEPEFFGFMRQI